MLDEEGERAFELRPLEPGPPLPLQVRLKGAGLDEIAAAARGA